MSEQITIDGKKIDFEPGDSIIEVATRSEIEIPYYCWHDRLSVAANCRMCLVDLEGSPKLVPACQTECRKDMVVSTTNDKVKGAQKAVHEFLLINHPIDCPICDQAGECKLQDYYMQYQLEPSRMTDRKVGKPRLEPLGPYVMYNAERCVMCTRCVRFMEEVAQDRQLGVFNRGDHSEIGVVPGKELDNPYSMNVVDICPVGALTSRVFRFKQRVWNLKRSDSVCGGCARGCNINVDQRSGQVYRFLPRENDNVNAAWMCDEGRLTYNRVNEGRITEPRAKSRGQEQQTVTAADALTRAHDILRQGIENKHIAVALTLHATCEEAYVLGRLAKEALGVQRIALLGYADGVEDELLRVKDKNPNRAGIEAVLRDLGVATCDAKALTKDIEHGPVRVLLCVGHEMDAPEGWLAALDKLHGLVLVAGGDSATARKADVILPGLQFVQVDGTWVNIEKRAQRLRPAFAPEGAAQPHDRWLMALSAKIGVSWALPSVQTIRAEMQQELATFKNVSLTNVGSAGVPL